MTNRRDFLGTSTLSAGALALTPSFANLFAMPNKGEAPRRFVFIRKSNGVRPEELALPTFSEIEKKADGEKQALEVDLENHELPAWMEGL